MNTKQLFAGVFLTLAIPTMALAGGAQPSLDWNGNYQHPSPTDKQQRLNVADKVKGAKAGAYGPMQVDTMCVMNQSTSGSVATQDNKNSQPSDGPDAKTEGTSIDARQYCGK